ncbi:MAG: hypothetical protein ACREVI_09425 [Steroidobacteraceae bacterium]
MNEQLRELERRSRAAFDDSVDSLDAATRSRLARARARALDQSRSQHAAWAAPWLPAGAAAAVALVAALLWLGDEDERQPPDPALVALEDIDIVAGGEDFEMLAADEGFYAWAAEEMADDVG